MLFIILSIFIVCDNVEQITFIFALPLKYTTVAIKLKAFFQYFLTSWALLIDYNATLSVNINNPAIYKMPSQYPNGKYLPVV